MDVTDRTLALLALLAGRAAWTGPELTARLGVTPRTLRRDVARLRSIGYRIDSTTGTAGGYRLAAGTRLPPLVFDDEEAVALAALLGQATGSPIEGADEAASRVLGKLGQVLPRRLRDRVAAISAVEHAGRRSAESQWQGRIVGEVVARLAIACRAGEVINFGYRDRAGRSSNRRVEPHRVITGYGWWYLVGYDLDRADWRTFRLDRVSSPDGTGRTVPPRDPPEGGAREYLIKTLAAAPYPHRVTIELAADESAIKARVGFLLPNRIQPTDNGHRVDFGSAELSDVVTVALSLIALGVSYQLEATPEVRTALREVGASLLAAL